MRDSRGAQPSAETGNRWLAPAVLLIAIGAAYGNTFSVPFHFDDSAAIRFNPSIQRLGIAMFFPPADATTGGRPLANVTYALNHAIGGLSTTGYHVVNLTIHVLAALVLFLLVRRILVTAAPGASASSRDSAADAPSRIAFGAALLWALHPLQTSSVTYLSQRTESLMGLFLLATLYGFVRGVTSSRPAPWLTLSVIACHAGMLTKETMVTAPVLVALFDRIFFAGSQPALWRQRRTYYIGLGLAWLVLAGLLTTGLSERSVGFGLGISPWRYALVECEAVLTYLRLALWPDALVFDYGALYDQTPAALFAGVVGIGVLIAIVVTSLRRWPRAGFLGAAFFLLLAPTSSVVPIARQPIAENRVYLPLAAVTVLMVLALHRFLGRRSRPAMLVLGAALGLAAHARNSVFRDPLALWADTIAKRPANSRAYENYGTALCDLGRFAEALPYCERAVRMTPTSADARAKVGDVLFNLGRLPEAVESYDRSLELNPHLERAVVNRAVILHQTGRTAEAIHEFARILQAHPAQAGARLNLALALSQVGRRDEALQHYAEGLRLNPGDAALLLNEANLLLAMARPADAVAPYVAALGADPALAAAHVGLSAALIQLGRAAEAEEHAMQAIRLQPRHAEAHLSRAIALYRLGRVPEALAEIEQSLALKPDYAEARQSLANLRAAHPGVTPAR